MESPPLKAGSWSWSLSPREGSGVDKDEGGGERVGYKNVLKKCVFGAV